MAAHSFPSLPNKTPWKICLYFLTPITLFPFLLVHMLIRRSWVTRHVVKSVVSSQSPADLNPWTLVGGIWQRILTQSSPSPGFQATTLSYLSSCFTAWHFSAYVLVPHHLLNSSFGVFPDQDVAIFSFLFALTPLVISSILMGLKILCSKVCKPAVQGPNPPCYRELKMPFILHKNMQVESHVACQAKGIYCLDFYRKGLSSLNLWCGDDFQIYICGLNLSAEFQMSLFSRSLDISKGMS